MPSELVIGEDGPGRLALARPFLVDAAFLRVDEQDIDVRTVVEFLAAKLAHAENTELGLPPKPGGILLEWTAKAGVELIEAKLEHGSQGDLCHIGNFQDNFRGRGQAGEVARGDAHHLALLELPQLRQRCRKTGGGTGGVD